MDEWLRKWNRTCPLCKSAIQRRRGDDEPPASEGTLEREEARLLSNEPLEGDSDHEEENYGAIGFSNPLTSDGSTSDVSSDDRRPRDRAQRSRSRSPTLIEHDSGIVRPIIELSTSPGVASAHWEGRRHSTSSVESHDVTVSTGERGRREGSDDGAVRV